MPKQAAVGNDGLSERGGFKLKVDSILSLAMLSLLFLELPHTYLSLQPMHSQ